MKKTGSHLSAHPFRERQSGMALLVVLWVVALMVLLVLVFSNAVQIEVRTATYRKDAAQAYSLACGGVQAAILEIAYPPSENQRPSPIWSWRRGQREGMLPFKGGQAAIQVVNESGKLDLNYATRGQLARLLEAHGLAQDKAYQLAKALVDWRSPPPANAQDVAPVGGGQYAPYESAEEALNVPGMSRALFYGSAEVDAQGKIRTRFGIGDDLTVRSRLSQLNVNYASEAALMSVPGITKNLAQAIVRARRLEPFKTVAEISDRTGESLPDEAAPLLTTSEISTYAITSTGIIEGSPVRRTIAAVVQATAQGALRYRVVSWYDDYWNE
jgi:general secretion pathway protein K